LRQQPFTTQPEGRALEAPRALKSEVSFGLLQVSPPHPRGRLWRRHEFIMPRPVCNFIHIIVLQCYVSFCVFISYVVSYFFPVSLMVRVVQYCCKWVCLRYLRPIWGPSIIFLLRVRCAKWQLLRKANAKWGVQSLQPA
jgi:hypothetical protein